MIKISTLMLFLGKIDLNINLFELETKMTDILAQPEQFKAELKEKWLDYYQVNRDWLEKIDGHGYRISDPWFILGIITALDPKSELRELLQYFLLVTKDCNSIIRALGLDFDTKKELEKRTAGLAAKQEKTASEYLDQIREEIKT
jgi:Family of unknown function (DUF5331)